MISDAAVIEMISDGLITAMLSDGAVIEINHKILEIINEIYNRGDIEDSPLYSWLNNNGLMNACCISNSL